MRSLKEIAASHGETTRDLLYEVMGAAQEAAVAVGPVWSEVDRCDCHVNRHPAVCVGEPTEAHRSCIMQPSGHLPLGAKVALRRHIAVADPEMVLALVHALFDAALVIDFELDDTETVADAPDEEADFDAEVRGFVERVAKLDGAGVAA